MPADVAALVEKEFAFSGMVGYHLLIFWANV
jgi:hypothetical protein